MSLPPTSPTPEPARPRLVTNTTPLIALAVACGSLDILRSLYSEVLVPAEVAQELTAVGVERAGVAEFVAATWLKPVSTRAVIAPYLLNILDRGEAAVIQTALDMNVPLVAIDEVVGRRVTRLAGLNVTGSIGIMLKARQAGLIEPMAQCIERLHVHGIWLSQSVIDFALAQEAGFGH